jgi:CRP/FNR family transcriptional regulator, cyclic AMP receptor protein
MHASELQRIELFQDLEAVELSCLAGHLQRKTFPAGTLLLSPEQPGDALFALLDGSVKIFSHRPDGSEVILALLGAGQTVGEMGLFASGLRSASVVTMERSTLLAMSGPAYRHCLLTMPALSASLNRLLCARLRSADERILALSSLDVAGRVAREILAFAERYGRPGDTGTVHIPLRLTQGDLAAIVGTSRERVNHAMVRFKERGYLSVDPSYHITVHDPAALAECCR